MTNRFLIFSPVEMTEFGRVCDECRFYTAISVWELSARVIVLMPLDKLEQNPPRIQENGPTVA